MDINEAKKYLYKNKPLAQFLYANIDGIYYTTDWSDKSVLIFFIPHSEFGQVQFTPLMPAHLLIRYIVKGIQWMKFADIPIADAQWEREPKE